MAEPTYGYFVHPDSDSSYFSQITDPTVRQRSAEDGGCLFTVDQVFIDGLKEILENTTSENRFYLVEIAGDADTIKSDPVHNSVFGLAELAGCKTVEEALELAALHGRFESVFFRKVLTHAGVCQMFPIRQLN